MSLALRLGLRNLRRAPRRTALTVAAGAGGLAVAMLIVNLARGIAGQAIDGAVRLGPGHLSVHRAGYLPLGDPARAISDADAVVRRIAAVPEVRSALPRLTVAGLARSGATTRAVLLVGVDPAAEAAISPLAGRVAQGAFLDRAGRDAVLLGTALAADLAVRVGDPVLLSAPGSGGAGDERSLRVGGILAAGFDEIAPGVAWADVGLVREIAGLPGAAHEIAVFLASPAPAVLADTGARIRAFDAVGGSGLEVTTWQQALPQLRDALALDALARGILILGLLGIVAIGAAATLFASVLERTRELGLLLALGTPPALLRGTVLAEAALLGCCSIVLGLAAGAAATAVLAHVGLDVRALFSDEVAYGGALFSLKIRPAWDWAQTGRAALLLLGVHLAAAGWPAWRAGATSPAAALRFR